MASDVTAVRLHLPQIRVLEVLEDALDVLRVSVESTFRRLRCAQCGFKCHRVHDRRDKKIRDPRLAPQRPGLQRPNRGHQPAPSPAAQRPQVASL